MDGVLSRGLLSGWIPSKLGDFRARMPRFRAENLVQNRKLVDRLRKLAAEKGISASQMAIAWVLAKSESIIPVMGARTRAQLSESLGALAVRLSQSEVDRIEEEIQQSEVVGERYDPHHMSMLDSEK